MIWKRGKNRRTKKERYNVRGGGGLIGIEVERVKYRERKGTLIFYFELYVLIEHQLFRKFENFPLQLVFSNGPLSAERTIVTKMTIENFWGQPFFWDIFVFIEHQTCLRNFENFETYSLQIFFSNGLLSAERSIFEIFLRKWNLRIFAKIALFW